MLKVDGSGKVQDVREKKNEKDISKAIFRGVYIVREHMS